MPTLDPLAQIPNQLPPTLNITQNGWTAETAFVERVNLDGTTSTVAQIVDWVGGIGSKPIVGFYIGEAGAVQDIDDAVDLKGGSGTIQTTLVDLRDTAAIDSVTYYVKDVNGLFIVDDTDTTSTDDGFYTIIASNDKRLKKKSSGNPLTILSVGDFSKVDDRNSDTVVLNDIYRGGIFKWYQSGYTVDNGIVFAGKNGVYVRQYVGEVNINWFGAVPGLTYGLGTATFGNNVFTSTSPVFNSTDVGKTIAIIGAGASQATHIATILTVGNPTSVILSAAPLTTLSPAAFYFGVDSTTAINTVLSTYRFGSGNGDYLATSLVEKSRLLGDARVLIPIKGGLRKSNIDNQKDYVYGQEHLAFFHRRLLDRANPSTNVKIYFGGDSTTQGDAITGVFTLSLLTNELFRRNSIDNVTCVNGGHSGSSTRDFDLVYADTEIIPAEPHLFVWSWGINDPGYKKDGSGGTLDKYEEEKALRRDVNDFKTSLYSGLTKIRAVYDQTECSIILCTPNSVDDTPNGRDAKWFEAIREVIREAAVDFQCAFFDKYGLFRDSIGAANLYMDNPFGDGRTVHPLNVMNSLIVSKMFSDLMCPEAILRMVGRGTYMNTSSVNRLPEATDVPGSFEFGLTTSRCLLEDGFPANGGLLTIRQADEPVLQLCYNFDGGTPEFYMRTGISTTWNGSFRQVMDTINVQPRVLQILDYLFKRNPQIVVVSPGTNSVLIPHELGRIPFWYDVRPANGTASENFFLDYSTTTSTHLGIFYTGVVPTAGANLLFSTICYSL